MPSELQEHDPKSAATARRSVERPINAAEKQELNSLQGGGSFEGAGERRRHPRAMFRALQKIAPYAGNGFPKPNEFRQVSCHGISAGGFSFFQNEPVLEREFVVTLTVGGQAKHFKARVVHAEATYTEEGLKFLVGCAFVGRIDPS